MTEYGNIYLKKQSAEYAKIMNMSDSVQSIRPLYKLLSSYWDRDVFRTLSNILGHFDKHCIENTRKKGTAGKHFEVFSPRYS